MDIEQRFETLKQEVDALQIQMGQDHGPWYSKSSNLIALGALLFSFGTTLVSAVNAHREDIRDNRREAREVIQRLTKLPIENFDLMQRSKGEGLAESLSGMITQENILLATQAAEMLERYPNSFSSTEYFAVAFALSSSNIADRVPYLFEQAIARARTSNDYNASTRAYASFLYSKGNVKVGREYYEMAMAVWDDYPESNLYIVTSTDLVTLMYWAQAEFGVNNLPEAHRRLGEARKRLEMLPPGPYTDSLGAQVEYTARLIGAP